MTGASIVPLLAILTLGAVVAFALISQQATIKRMNDPEAPKSKLAEDEPTPVSAPGEHRRDAA